MASGLFSVSASAAPTHSTHFRIRRFLNWFPLGLTYAFLYMGRYNLTVAKNALGGLMTNEDFGIIFGLGALTYGLAFVANGPLTDKIGGKRALLLSAFGSALMNLLMGVYLQRVVSTGSINNINLRFWFSLLYAGNMYFQSFGAVAIVKVNAHWFHVRERGSFSGIFGTMISSGIFLAFKINPWILDLAKAQTTDGDALYTKWVFFAPSALLFAMFLVEAFLLKDRPGLAGQKDFDTGDASSGDEENPSFLGVLRKVISNPVILTIALIEFCTGVIRQGVMHWYPIYSKSVLALPSKHYLRDGAWDQAWLIAGIFSVSAVFFALAYFTRGPRKSWLYASGGLVFLVPFLQQGWGGILMVAGIIGGNVAGRVSDFFFQSRRVPAAGGLYCLLFICTVGMAITMGQVSTTVASSKVPELLPGDRILKVAGKEDLKDWAAVTQAFGSVPATCLLGSVWDSKKKLCSTSPEATDAALIPSSGFIDIEVERRGTVTALKVKDPNAKMRAGDTRTLAATPVTSLSPYWLAAVVFLMSLGVIGTHGLLSGTATMDFGGRKGAGTAVGIIDGCVYLGTFVQSVSLGYLTTHSWNYWPWFLMPFGLIGFLLSLRIWNAKPTPKSQGAKQVASVPASGQVPASLPGRTGTR